MTSEPAQDTRRSRHVRTRKLPSGRAGCSPDPLGIRPASRRLRCTILPGSAYRRHQCPEIARFLTCSPDTGRRHPHAHNSRERVLIERVDIDARSGTMSTERPSPRYSEIDSWEAADSLDAMIEGQFVAVAAVRGARVSIENAAKVMEARLRYRGRLVYVGAGTSGRLAVQDGAELMPTFSWPLERLLLVMAGGPGAFTRSIEGAEDKIEDGLGAIREYRVDSNDVVIAVAASGTTPFTLACLREAKRCGALTIGIANNRDTPLLREADHPIFLDTGAEPIAGSTRMNAGTAQRIALTLLSSLLMIRLGRVY